MEFLTFNLVVAFLSLVIVLIILDVDNIIFISILTNDLPEKEKPKAKNIGFILSVLIRTVLLLAAGQLAKLETKLFEVNIDLLKVHTGFSVKDIMVTAGGLFLLYKSTSEIYQKLEGPEVVGNVVKTPTFAKVMASVAVLNFVFSIDSVITAVGMTSNVVIMFLATFVSLTLMFIFQGAIGDFISKHPSAKMLALSFLILIGVFLVIEGVHVVHIPKGYIYFAMAFSLSVELMNIRLKKKGKPVSLHDVQHLKPTSENK